MKLAESRALDASRAKLRNFADQLLSVALKADGLRQGNTQNEALLSQQQMLDTHIGRVTDWLGDELVKGGVDVTAERSIAVGINAGGIAADLMHLDEIGVATKTPLRAYTNRGLAWTWEVMRELANDPAWAVTHRDKADWAVDSADKWRETTVDHLMPMVANLRAGSTAAMITDFAINVPTLLATGSNLLKALAEWISKGGGGGGGLSLATVGGGTVMILTSGGRSVVLTAEQIEALISAGILSEKTYAIYHMSMAAGGGSTAGPLGARPPGSKSRYSDKELAKDYLKEIGKPLPTGERAGEEMGSIARKLRNLYERHHLLVQQLRRWFASAGVDIDKYVIKLTADEHHWIHNEYRWNDLWIEFRLEHPMAEAEEIIAKMKELQRIYGLEGLELVKYP